MRHIDRQKIVDTVAKLCVDAALYLPEDVFISLKTAKETEASPIAKEILSQLIENAQIAKGEETPICQDTGLCIVFAEIGREIHFNYDIYDAINEGIGKGYCEGYLRKSMVRHPLDRVNTQNNTPGVIHIKLTEGDKLTLTVAPKGGGSENMSVAKVFPPAVGEEGVIDFIKETVRKAQGNPCPPVVLGVGIGGNLEYDSYLSKKALTREVGVFSKNPIDRALEEKIIKAVNETGVGPSGFGGDTTCLFAFVESYPCHIASLPVALSINCHAARHKSATL
ncbi:MAG: fumarate hydratase [Abditibacteriota bacterium]|nr:fumarate hydratase [Abditibacteriota bacterium]